MTVRRILIGILAAYAVWAIAVSVHDYALIRQLEQLERGGSPEVVTSQPDLDTTSRNAETGFETRTLVWSTTSEIWEVEVDARTGLIGEISIVFPHGARATALYWATILGWIGALYVLGVAVEYVIRRGKARTSQRGHKV